MDAWVENTLYAPIDNEPLALAAALRAAADQITEEVSPVEAIITIATELEAHC